MAKIRTVKPALFRHEALFQAELDTGLPLRVSFIGLFTVADREGRFKWRPREIKLDVLPYDTVDFSRVLDALMTRGFIRKYSVDGVEYGLIPTFTAHQVINNRESESCLPAPPEMEENREESASSTRLPRVPHASATRHDPAQAEMEMEMEGNNSCSEPEVSKPPVIEFPTNKFNTEGETYPVSQEQIDTWTELFPAVDVMQSLRECKAWNLANPGRRKTKSGMAKHITAWLANKQNKPGFQAVPRAPVIPHPATNQNLKDLRKVMEQQEAMRD